MKKIIFGFAMIEVLISMGIVSLVFLSLLAYQLSVLKNTNQSNFQAIAQLQLMNFAEMLRVNQSESYREKALTQWNQDNDNLLPNADGDFVLQDDHQCHIVLKWIDRKQRREAVDVFC